MRTEGRCGRSLHGEGLGDDAWLTLNDASAAQDIDVFTLTGKGGRAAKALEIPNNAKKE